MLIPEIHAPETSALHRGGPPRDLRIELRPHEIDVIAPDRRLAESSAFKHGNKRAQMRVALLALPCNDQGAVLHADDEKDFGKAGATPTSGNLPRFRKSTRMSTRMNRRRIRS
jgi:hypothetical protein